MTERKDAMDFLKEFTEERTTGRNQRNEAGVNQLLSMMKVRTQNRSNEDALLKEMLKNTLL
jgi:hypothetical protein